MALSPIAARLLGRIEQAQQAFIARSGAEPCVQAGLTAARQAIAAALDTLDEELILRLPAPDEWCMAEVAEHVAEHDLHFVEIEARGATHYVEHGLEHALQLWNLRSQLLGIANAGR